MKKLIAAVLVAGVLSAHAEEKAPSENSIALGVTMTDGNSDTLLATVGLEHNRKRDGYSLRLALDGAYGEDKDETTTENVKGVGEYRKLLSERAYILGSLSALYDSIADVDYRVIVGVGPGYFLMKDEAASLGVEVGPAFIAEEVGGVESEEWALRVGQRYERQLSPTAKTWQSLEYLPLVDDFDDYLLNAEIGIEAAINSRASIRLVVKNAYDSTPAADAEKSDTTLIGALAFQL
ncbi:MAG TPA: DUF481 domain-containing protein [Kiritimatiellia bacterium]|nr:DUF481 domain-containing protein [Kiritimatiellia bacterium]